MVQYRRSRVAGGSYFFPVTLEHRRSRALLEHVSLLRECFHAVRKRAPFHIDAIVIFPEHLHAIWTLPCADHDYASRWGSIKSLFTRTLNAQSVPIARRDNGGYRLWQRRYWEHTLRDEEDFRHHVEYIWFNPVKHGLVRRVMDWPHSSFHRAVDEGWVRSDWGGQVSERDIGYGE